MAAPEHFRVSSHLKDIIGRDLVTNQFVAVFELVKNSVDAHAERIDIGFELDDDRMWIVDDGKGMSAETIRDRWLFVGYSAKADGTEEEHTPDDYRDHIRRQGNYAGSKGIGRFSCDTLGRSLTLFSRFTGEAVTHKLRVKWPDFEEDARALFQEMNVRLDTVDGFPSPAPVGMPAESGTALRIDGLRAAWDAEEIRRLRRYLEKLIDPFGTTESTPVHISVRSTELEEEEREGLEGPVGNDLRDLLSKKTTRINVSIEDTGIRTELVDRGRPIYRISEDNDYEGLKGTSVRAEVYFLNHAAKTTFKLRMGVRSVTFGSIFLFINGFRIFPIGEETDDEFGLNRRKQQGITRYVSTRDVMGRVDVTAPPRFFREASSRDAGLIEDVRVRDLYDAIRKKAVFRLERYVVGVTWKDKADKYREDPSALSSGTTRGRVAEIVGQLASATAIKLDYYDPKIVEIFEEGTRSPDTTLKSLVAIAQRKGDPQLLQRAQRARARVAELEQSEKEAVEVAERARAERARADERAGKLERQATFLAQTQDMTAEQMTLLLHQVLIYAGHIGAAVRRALASAAQVASAAQEIPAAEVNREEDDSAAAIRVYNNQVVDDLGHIHLENDRLMAVARFATNTRFKLESDQVDGDVVAFFDDYVNKIRADRDGVAVVSFDSNGLSLVAKFRPADIVVVVDNLIDNARKHRAKLMKMRARPGRAANTVEVVVTDDGLGIDEDEVDPERIFDKGYRSSPGGTGLGLYHARMVMANMGGGIHLDPGREPGRATFIIVLQGET